MAWNWSGNGGTSAVFAGVPGFENVKSDLFTAALGSIPRQNAEMQMLLAGKALEGAWQKKINDDTLAYNYKVLDETNKQARRNALRLAGSALSSFLPAAAVAEQASLDPRVLQQQQAGHAAAMRQYRRAGQTATAGSVLQALNQLGAA